MLNEPTLEELEAEIARRESEAARGSLLEFILKTCEGYEASWFHAEVCRALDQFLADVIAKRSPRLMLFAPPRHGKTELVSRRFPAYALGRAPDLTFIAASYGDDLASRINRDVQTVIDSPAYLPIFPNTRIAGLNARGSSAIRNADMFETVNAKGERYKGMYRSAGVGGGITGMGAHCLPGSTPIITDEGPVAIEALWARTHPCKVLSYCEGVLSYEAVEAVTRRSSTGFYRVTSAAGRVVEATGEHPFYTEGKWVRADSLTPGTPIVFAVRESVRAHGVRGEQEPSEGVHGHLLRSGVFQRSSFVQEPASLSHLSETHGQEDQQISSCLSAPTQDETLPGVQSGVPRANNVLLGGVCEQRPLLSDARGRQPEVEARGHAPAATTTLREGVSPHAAKGVGAGRMEVRRLPSEWGSAGGSPPRRESSEQRGQQPCNSVLTASSNVARGQGFETVHDTVARVEFVCEETVVYDLQVARAHNFFASGCLVHNCLIVDDPVKDAEQANSEVYRNKVWDWFSSTAYTRLMPGGGVLIIMTRWHEDDLAGRLLARMKSGEGETYQVLSFPAIAEQDEKYRRKGEPLHAERYSLDALARIRKSVAERVWISLYQQRPSAAEGNRFKRDAWRFWRPDGQVGFARPDGCATKEASPTQPLTEDYRFDEVCISVDANFKDRKDADPATVWVVGRKGTARYLLDRFSGPVGFGKTCAAIKAMKAKYPRARKVYIEAKANGDAIIESLRAEMTGIIEVPKEISNSGKEARAEVMEPVVLSGNWYLPEHMAWTADVVEQFATFPNGLHDDDVDAGAQLECIFTQSSELEWARRMSS